MVRAGPPRTNLMLIDQRQRDLGWTRNIAVLATVVKALAWEERVALAIAMRYPWDGKANRLTNS